MKMFFVSLCLLAHSASFATDVVTETCYQLSSSSTAWSRTPETLCVEMDSDNSSAILKLTSGLPFNSQTVAVFNMDLLLRARCLDCNKDVFGVANPTNSVFNNLQIKFDGARDISTGAEQGKVQIGGTTFFYRK